MIKKIQKYSIATMVAVLFGACSGDSGFSADEETPELKSIQLVIGEPVEVNTGDTLNPANEETEINVEHIISEDIKKVTLLKGEATLVYGNYDVEEVN